MRSGGSDEPGNAQQSHDERVHREGQQGSGLEEAYEESNRQVGGDSCEQRAYECLCANAIAEVAGEVRDLVDARGENDRCR